jgi:hypothetical protein
LSRLQLTLLSILGVLSLLSILSLLPLLLFEPAEMHLFKLLSRRQLRLPKPEVLLKLHYKGARKNSQASKFV